MIVTIAVAALDAFSSNFNPSLLYLGTVLLDGYAIEFTFKLLRERWEN